jgi:hypothetical protein
MGIWPHAARTDALRTVPLDKTSPSFRGAGESPRARNLGRKSAPLWVPAAEIAYAAYKMPFLKPGHLVIQAILWTIFAYGGAFIFGLPVFHALGFFGVSKSQILLDRDSPWIRHWRSNNLLLACFGDLAVRSEVQYRLRLGSMELVGLLVGLSANGRVRIDRCRYAVAHH